MSGARRQTLVRRRRCSDHHVPPGRRDVPGRPSMRLTSGCTLLASIPLLIFWLQTDVKRYYHVE